MRDRPKITPEPRPEQGRAPVCQSILPQGDGAVQGMGCAGFSRRRRDDRRHVVGRVRVPLRRYGHRVRKRLQALGAAGSLSWVV